MSRATILEINLDNIAYNLRQFKKVLPNSELMAVVKADAYGHGAIRVAEVALEEGATWLGVATVSEGIELRKAGFKVPILVLGGLLAEEMLVCSQNQIDVAVYSKDFSKQVEQYSRLFEEPLNIHITVDTGMHRLGILPEDLTEFLMDIKQRKCLKVRGIFSHFPDAAGDYDFSNKQIDSFKECVKIAEDVLGKIEYKHMANSAAIFKLPNSHFDLVRLGLGLYGYHDDLSFFNDLDLKPAMVLKSRITSIRQVKANERVGYGRTYLLERDGKIATIPIGYADGYKRSLSNKAFALVNGFKVRLAGRVCMDQTMIDVTDIPDISEGDEVIILGKQGNNEISMYDICKWADTIPNDILTSFKERINKTYLSRL